MDLLGIPLLGENAGAGRHITDVVDELRPLGGVVEVVPHRIRLSGDDGGQQSGPAADLEFDFRAQACQHGTRKISVEADDIVEVLGVAETVWRAFAVLADTEGFSRNAWIFARERTRRAFRHLNRHLGGGRIEASHHRERECRQNPNPGSPPTRMFHSCRPPVPELHRDACAIVAAQWLARNESKLRAMESRDRQLGESAADVQWTVSLGLGRLGAARPLPKFAPSNDERAGGELFPAGGEGMGFHPMLRDFAAGANPDPVMPQDMIEKTHQPGSTTRTADETVMQAHRHHLWL